MAKQIKDRCVSLLPFVLPPCLFVWTGEFKMEMLMRINLDSMGSTSTPAGGAAKANVITPGQSVSQQAASGCC